MDQNRRGDAVRSKNAWRRALRCSLYLLMLAPAGLAAFGPAAGRADVESIRKELTGARGRTWVFERIEVVMGETGRCKAGETRRFVPGDAVVIRKCVDGKLKVTHAAWHLSSLNELDVLLHVTNEAPMIISFYTRNGDRWKRLSTPPENKTTERIVRLFRLEED